MKWTARPTDFGGLVIYPDPLGKFDTELAALDHGIAMAKMNHSALTSNLKTMRYRYKYISEST